jgi:hypothetical protein
VERNFSYFGYSDLQPTGVSDSQRRSIDDLNR